MIMHVNIDCTYKHSITFFMYEIYVHASYFFVRKKERLLSRNCYQTAIVIKRSLNWKMM